MKNKYIYLVLIFILGALLRFYMLGSMPVGFHTDEAYFGYNAYSIFKTGNEITGDHLPVHLKSFLYSPAAYSYFSIPSIAIFGLNAFSTRFASAFFGSITILLAYFLTRKLLTHTKFKEKNADVIALITSLFIAISPWNINLSRVATENVIVVFLISLGVYLFILWRERDNKLLFVSAFLCFFIALFTYQAPRSFLPLFLPCLFLFTFSKKDKQKIIWSVVAFLLVIILPVLYILRSPDLAFRIRTLSIMQNPETQLQLEEQIRENGVANVPPPVARLFNNKAINYSETFLTNYFNHFSYNFLFTDAGFPERYKVPGMGIMYLFDIPFVILGLWYLYSTNKRLALFLTAWVLIGPVGSAFTFDDIPNLQRTLIVFPVLAIISACGFYFIYTQLLSLKNKKIGNVLIGIIVLVAIYSLTYYLHAYYIIQKYHQPWQRQEGYEQMINQVNQNEGDYKKVVITNSIRNPSIFLFFFNKMDPSVVQKIIKENTKGENYGEVSFGKYVISTDECPVREYVDTDKVTGVATPKLVGQKGVLYIDGGGCELPSFGVNAIADVKRNDGTSAFKIFSLK